jgi:hypothetical protein
LRRRTPRRSRRTEKTTPEDAERALDELYGLAPEEFVSARNTLASEVRKQGDRESADRIKSLAKPAVGAWILNQLARERPDLVEGVLEAGRRLRKEQEKAVRGSDATDLQGATSEHRASVRNLVDAAERLLDSSGRPAAAGTLQKVAETLAATANDQQAAELLKAGRLTQPLRPEGFGFGAALETMAGTPKDTKRSNRGNDAQRARLEAAREAVSQAKESLRVKSSEAAAAAEEARRAERTAISLRKKGEAATARAEQARQALLEAEDRLKATRSAAK